jgi:hypothetical protein
MSENESWIVLGLFVAWVLMIIGITISVIRMKRKYKRYLGELPPEKRAILEGKSYHLGAKLNFQYSMRFYRGGPLPGKVSGDSTLLPLLQALGGFAKDHWEKAKCSFTLDGQKGMITWELSGIHTLGWLEPIAQAWRELGEIKTKLMDDSSMVFRKPYWPEKTLAILQSFGAGIDLEKLRGGIDDSTIKESWDHLDYEHYYPLLMTLRPPGNAYDALTKWEYIPSLPPAYLGRILEEIGIDRLVEYKIAFGTQIVRMLEDPWVLDHLLVWLAGEPRLVYELDFWKQGGFVSLVEKDQRLRD